MTTEPKTKPRKRKSGQRYRAYLNHELMQMAFLAGEGRTPSEIAAAMGGGLTGAKVGAQLRRYAVRMPRRGDDDIMQLRWSRRDRLALEEIASKRLHDAPDIAVIALRILIAEPILFGNLLDEVEQLEKEIGAPLLSISP